MENTEISKGYAQEDSAIKGRCDYSFLITIPEPTEDYRQKMSREYLKSVSILYVEDNEDIRSSISLYLKKWGCIFYIAANGKEGLEIFYEKKPHVVISDIMMPVMNGLDMAERIKKSDPHVHIILTTGLNEQDYLIRALNIGIEKYVLKPIKPKVLLDALIQSATLIFHQKEIEAENEFVRFVLDSSPSLMLTTSGQEIDYVNRTLLEYLGYESLNALQSDYRKLKDLLKKIVKNPSSVGSDEFIDSILCQPHMSHTVYLQPGSPDRPAKAYSMSCNSFPALNRCIYSFSDVSKIERERREFEQQAVTDGLTGLYNRTKIAELLLGELTRARRYSTVFSVIMFDIDYFKDVNDVYGHETGDGVLMAISELAALNIRDQDILARWGGEEFLVLAPETDLKGARNLARKLKERIERTNFGSVERITCSFGVTQWNKNDNLDTIINRADQAMYKAKNGGRNRVDTL